MAAAEAFERPSPEDVRRASAELSREVALLCDAAGILLWADERAVRMFDCEPGDDLIDFMASNSRTKYQEFLKKASEGRLDRWELAMRSRTGTTVFECTAFPLRGRILIVASKLPDDHGSSLNEMSMLVSELSALQRESSRQKAELQRLLVSLGAAHDRIEREREILETIVGQLPSGVLVADDREDKPIIANAALEEILGSLPDDLGSLPSDLTFMDSDGVTMNAEDWPVYRSLVNGEVIEDVEIQLVKPDGDRRTILVSSVPIWNGGDDVRLAVAVFHDITRQKDLQQQLRHDSLHDSLTGLPNRKLFGMRLAETLRRGEDQTAQVAVLFVDLDDFKQVNDRLGHHIGDRLLVETGRLLRDAVRSQDFVARLAGDEFVVLLGGIHSKDVVEAVVRRVLSSFSRPIVIDGHSIECGMSIGIALSDGESHASEDLIERADSAMYAAKDRGKGQYFFADSTPAE